jgi:phosphatidylserine/phosphatidylglycerophosphate/cardiolipin synthase-like enzyme
VNYRRILVLTELGGDAGPVFAAIRRFAPAAERIAVVAQQPAPLFAWLTEPAPPELNDAARRALEDLREAASRAAPEVEVSLAPELTPEALAEMAAAFSADLVAGGASIRTLSLLAGLRERRAVPVLCVRSPSEAPPPGAGNRLLCVGLEARERRAVLDFLRSHAAPPDRAVLLSSRRQSPEDLREMRQLSGIAPGVELIDGSGEPLRRLLGARGAWTADLVVFARFPGSVLIGLTSGPPVLVLPPLRPAPREWQRSIDMPDLVDDGALIRARLEYAVGVGRTPIADQALAFVRDGELVARADSHGGEAELPSGIGDALSVRRILGGDTVDPLAPMAAPVAVLRAGERTLLLFDAGLSARELALVRRAARDDPVGVRVRSMRSCASLRAKLGAARLPPRVIDAGAVLGEGEASDVPNVADAVRLARVAARMRACGFPVAAIVYRGMHAPAATGFSAVRPEELASAAPTAPAAPGRLDATTGSPAIEGNRIEVELDNRLARDWLLAAIGASRRHLHFQTYMALDDDVGRPVEAALAAAAARGVAVRVLVDSLHGLHGSLGVRNPILERLAQRPGVELRVVRPIGAAPSLEDLKQRDHRKLLVADGEVALAGGRNLSHEYYTGFDEISLHADMPWRMVPWLDAGARLEGPAVAAVERSFLQAWTDAGGEPYEVRTPPRAGPTPVRVVVHRGLRDAYTLDAYLALIETARSHVTVVNGAPLLLEIQHALLRALRRGVRVRTLFGNLTPSHAGGPFRGPWASARALGTSFVHSRMDALVAAGAECRELVVPSRPGWDPGLGDVRPHVHAKVVSADGRACAVGSANLDITAGYWESELLLVIEDEAVARALEARLDELIAGSHRVERDDPEWRRTAEQRQWMRYWPGVLTG